MGYFQCPRCYGTDSFKQREQQFTSNGNGGIGIANVTQRYCRRCSHVKMGYNSTPLDWYIVTAAFCLFIVSPVIANYFQSGKPQSEESKSTLLNILNFIGLFLAIYFYRIFARLRYPKKAKTALSLNRGEPHRILSRQKAVGLSLVVIIFFNLLYIGATRAVESRIKCSKGSVVKYELGPAAKCPAGFKLKK